MKILLYLHQLPQNVLGLLVIFFTGAVRYQDVWITTKYRFGVSLGNYIIFGGRYTDKDYKHEHGHQFQSKRLGWLYLLLVGLPSIVRNIWDRVAHKNWSWKKHNEWYYGSYPEKQADELGGVRR